MDTVTYCSKKCKRVNPVFVSKYKNHIDYKTMKERLRAKLDKIYIVNLFCKGFTNFGN